jgi:hypothetical protein
MAVDTSLVGQVCGRRVVRIERGPVSVFAQSVKDESRVYKDRRAAEEAGFDNIPAPPTFPFAMAFWGTFNEDQEGLERVEHNPMWELMGKLGAGLILHGEQDFIYERPVVVGDVLYGVDTLTDVYERETSSHMMTFVVNTTEWFDYSSGEPGDLVCISKFNVIHRRRR